MRKVQEELQDQIHENLKKFSRFDKAKDNKRWKKMDNMLYLTFSEAPHCALINLTVLIPMLSCIGSQTCCFGLVNVSLNMLIRAISHSFTHKEIKKYK